MNKKELVSAIAAKTNFTGVEAGKALDALIEAVTETLKNGGGVQLSGFLSIKVSEKAARDALNPATGAKIKIPAKKIIKIKPAAALEEAIN